MQSLRRALFLGVPKWDKCSNGLSLQLYVLTVIQSIDCPSLRFFIIVKDRVHHYLPAYGTQSTYKPLAFHLATSYAERATG